MKALLPSRAAMHRKRSVRRMSIQAKSKMVIDDEDEAQYQTTWHLPRGPAWHRRRCWTELCTDLSTRATVRQPPDVGACFWRFFWRDTASSRSHSAHCRLHRPVKAEAGRFDCPARPAWRLRCSGSDPTLRTSRG